MARTLIELRDVYKIYASGDQPVHALDGVSLCIREGEFVAIVGHSGSGKSTLMNMIGCLDMPTGGSYCLAGQEVSRMGDEAISRIRNQEIGFVFQGFNLIPSMNALENVELPLLYRGVRKEMRRQMAAEGLAKVGLAGRMAHRPGQMSGGQQQRVAIARAIVAKPPILLADEPTGNLDSQSGAEVMCMLRELHADGKTIVLITHDREVAMQAQRTVHLCDGKIVEDKKVYRSA